MADVLVVEDSPELAMGLTLMLERAGHVVRSASTGQDGLEKFFARPSDLVLLDVEMPVMDGWATLARLRDASDVPVLMLTAHADELEVVRGLQAGADDYQTKPFSAVALLARVGALLRRPRSASEPLEYEDERIRVNFATHQVFAGDGSEVSLSALEFRLLATLVRRSGELHSHDELIERIWGSSLASRDQLKTYVRYLRAKLGWDAQRPLESVRGVGYRYHA